MTRIAADSSTASPQDPTGRTPAWFLTAVVALVGLRIAFVAGIFAVDGSLIRPDSPLYLTLAQNLNDLGWFSAATDHFTPEVFRTPGYPAFLAVFHRLELEAEYWPIAAQHLLYLATIALLYSGTRRLLEPALSRALVVYLLVEPGGLAYPSFFLSDTPALFLMTSTILALGFALQNRSLALIATCGLLLGLATLVRPAAMYLSVIYFFVIWLADGPNRRALGRGVLLVLVFTLVISPWLVRNYHWFGVPYVSAQASNMFANYHVPLVWESVHGIPFNEGQRQFSLTLGEEHARREQEVGHPLGLAEANQLRQQLALAELARHPIPYAYQWGTGILKTLLGTNVTEVYESFHLRTDRLHYFEITETNFTKKMLIFISNQDPLFLLELAVRLLITLLACIGAIVILGSRNAFLFAVLLTSAYFVFIPGPMGLGRLRFPVEGLIFIQAWIGWRALAGLWRSR